MNIDNHKEECDRFLSILDICYVVATKVVLKYCQLVENVLTTTLGREQI